MFFPKIVDVSLLPIFTKFNTDIYNQNCFRSSVCTFNVLCDEYYARNIKGGFGDHNDIELINNNRFEAFKYIFDTILKDIDIICLQEYSLNWNSFDQKIMETHLILDGRDAESNQGSLILFKKDMFYPDIDTHYRINFPNDSSKYIHLCALTQLKTINNAHFKYFVINTHMPLQSQYTQIKINKYKFFRSVIRKINMHNLFTICGSFNMNENKYNFNDDNMYTRLIPHYGDKWGTISLFKGLAIISGKIDESDLIFVKIIKTKIYRNEEHYSSEIFDKYRLILHDTVIDKDISKNFPSNHAILIVNFFSDYDFC